MTIIFGMKLKLKCKEQNDPFKDEEEIIARIKSVWNRCASNFKLRKSTKTIHTEITSGNGDEWFPHGSLIQLHFG